MCTFLNFDGRVAVVTGGAAASACRSPAPWPTTAPAFTSSTCRPERKAIRPRSVPRGRHRGFRQRRAAVAQLTDPVSLLVNNAGITRDRPWST